MAIGYVFIGAIVGLLAMCCAFAMGYPWHTALLQYPIWGTATAVSLIVVTAMRAMFGPVDLAVPAESPSLQR